MQKNVLITGAAKRIGADCARLLHSHGCNIFMSYNASQAEALRLCDELNSLRPDSAQAMQADLLDMENLAALAAAASCPWGHLDVLVNNASAFYPTPMDAVTEQQWDELLGSNLKAPFFLAKHLAASLSAQQGCIVNMVDIHAERGLKDYPVYSIAKAGLVAMTKVLAKELAPNVRVNGVAPGTIVCSEQELSLQQKAELLPRIALNRTGGPLDIAKAVLFLIKDADFMTGQILTVDGGRTLFY
ncbi:pteridine reductase [Methylosoma difficile]